MASKGVKVKLNDVLGTYVNLVEPARNSNGVWKYSTTCVFTDDDEDRIDEIKRAIEQVAVEAFGKNASKMLEKGVLKSPLRHADDVMSEYAQKEPFIGNYFMRVSSNVFGVNNADQSIVPSDIGPFKALVDNKKVDGVVSRITDHADCYSGCRMNVVTLLKAYDNESKGVAAYLVAVQVTDKGEDLSSSVDLEQEFDYLEESDLSAIQ